MSDDLIRGRERLLEDAAFRLLVESVVDYAIFILDARGNVATWNPGAERIKGYRAAEIVGQHFSRFFPEEDIRAEKPAHELERAAREGRFEDEGWRLRKDGTRFWANVVITALRDEGGSLIGFAKVTRDLTERRRAEQDRIAVAGKSARAFDAMSEMALALADARTVADVANVVLERGMGIVDADTCFLYLLDDSGHNLELVAHRGVALDVVARTRLVNEMAGGGDRFRAMRGGVSLWAETEQDYARIFPSVHGIPATGRRARAFWCTPLVVEGRPIGLFGMGFYEERRFEPEARTLADTLSKQCAQALLRAKRLEQEERTQAWIATTLRSIGDAVIATDPAGRVTFMNAVAEGLTGWTEAEAHGHPLDEVFAIFSEGTGSVVESPVTKVLRDGVVVGLANHTVLRARRGVEVPIDDSAAPIRDAAGTLFGVVLVFRDATREKQASARREFLVRAGAALASSLDYRATLATVAQLAVPQLADWCGVDVLEPGTTTSQQLAVAHVDPKKVQWARELGQKYPPDPNAPTGVPQVLRTGKSELYREIPGALLEAGARDEEHLRIIRELKLESAMAVPLRGRARTVGVMTFIYADSGRRYSEEDLAFAEEFARRAALAIENAWAMKEVADARNEERALRLAADVANHAKDDFLATVSHELRTPLNAILGWTLTLRSRKPPADVDRGLAIIERNARRQTRLIEDVLDVSRIISGKMALTMAQAVLAEIIDGAIEAVMPAADA
ncbi:MAG TPA: PAS domain S-box protein, partial [Polyangiaceae bacterium]|nr:PAS domain S-box protein [Polyangiaceae bacterium]